MNTSMKRTTVMLPQELRKSAKRLAKSRRISLGELIRATLSAEVSRNGTRKVEKGSFWDLDFVYRGPLRPGAPKHHDDIYDNP